MGQRYMLSPTSPATVYWRKNLVRNACGIIGHELYELHSADKCCAFDQITFAITTFLVTGSADEESATCGQVILHKVGHWLKTFFFDGVGYAFHCQAYTFARQKYHGVLA